MVASRLTRLESRARSWERRSDMAFSCYAWGEIGRWRCEEWGW
jgi:hypothetical protein